MMMRKKHETPDFNFITLACVFRKKESVVLEIFHRIYVYNQP